jgi:hypothetical protein
VQHSRRCQGFHTGLCRRRGCYQGRVKANQVEERAAAVAHGGFGGLQVAQKDQQGARIEAVNERKEMLNRRERGLPFALLLSKGENGGRCVCVRVREKEREKERERLRQHSTYVCELMAHCDQERAANGPSNNAHD